MRIVWKALFQKSEERRFGSSHFRFHGGAMYCALVFAGRCHALAVVAPRRRMTNEGAQDWGPGLGWGSALLLSCGLAWHRCRE